MSLGVSSIIIVFYLMFLLAGIGAGLYALYLLTRFVQAHQRGAEALEQIARKLPISPAG